MSQTIDTSGSSGFPLTLGWVDWNNGEHEVVYTIDGARLERAYSQGGVLSNETLIAEFISDEEELTNCVSDNGVLSLKIPAIPIADIKMLSPSAFPVTLSVIGVITSTIMLLLPAAQSQDKENLADILRTCNWKQTGYRGPCPPIGKHRYFHKLYALDIVLPDLGIPTKAKVEKAMEGHVLARAELVGLYSRT